MKRVKGIEMHAIVRIIIIGQLFYYYNILAKNTSSIDEDIFEVSRVISWEKFGNFLTYAGVLPKTLLCNMLGYYNDNSLTSGTVDFPFEYI